MIRPGPVAAWAPLLLTLLLACSDATGPEDFTDPRDVAFHPSLGVDLDAMIRTASGLHLQDLVVGEGEEASAGDSVAVRYRGWLADGTPFDASGQTPFEFRLGVGRVIPGWDEGVEGVRTGGERLLVIPPQLAYGLRGVPDVIPPNAVLVFRVELVAVLEEDAGASAGPPR